jgi:hypothetical protein
MGFHQSYSLHLYLSGCSARVERHPKGPRFLPASVSRLLLPGAVGATGAYGALVASQFDLTSTESGFEANTVVATPTNFPSFR